MTYQDKKRLLGCYLMVKQEYKEQLERHRELKETLDGLKAQILSDMPKSERVSSDRFGSSLAIIEQLEVRNTSLFQKYKWVEDIIEGIDDSLHREFIRSKYIDGLSPHELAIKYSYAYEYVFELERKILNKLEIKL